MINRWYIYQKERFPVLAYALLVAVFSFATLSFSSLLRDHTSFPSKSSILVAFLSAFFFFLQLRIADEFKDHEEDKVYRSYLPVPRGVITLKELGGLFIFGVIVQLGLAIWYNPPMVILLLLAWGYLALMSKEFFVRDWLKDHPFTYMWSHMFIMPLVDFYAASCDWMVHGNRMPDGFVFFLATSFFNGMILEIGRKIRAPEDEEEGVQTYSSAWGREKAVYSWLAVIALTMICALLAAARINYAIPVACVLSPLYLFGIYVAYRFLKQPAKKWAKLFEALAGVWTLLMYLSIGVLPRLLHF